MNRHITHSNYEWMTDDYIVLPSFVSKHQKNRFTISCVFFFWMHRKAIFGCTKFLFRIPLVPAIGLQSYNSNSNDDCIVILQIINRTPQLSRKWFWICSYKISNILGIHESFMFVFTVFYANYIIFNVKYLRTSSQSKIECQAMWQWQWWHSCFVTVMEWILHLIKWICVWSIY